MKFTKTLAAITAAAMAMSSIAVMASAEDVTPEEDVAASGFAAFFMQNNGGDWAWFANEEETTDLNEPGEYEVVWSDVQSVITKTAGDVSLSLLKAPAEEWEAYPSIGIQVGSSLITKAGQAGKVDAVVADITITLTDGTVIELEDVEAKADLLGKQEDWGVSGNNVMVKFNDAIKAKLGLADDAALFETLKTVASMSAKLTLNEVSTIGTTEVVLDSYGVMVNDGGWRVNLHNPWADDTMKIIDPAAMVGTKTISVKFMAKGVTAPFTAWLALCNFADTEKGQNSISYWGPTDEAVSNVTHTPIEITEDGFYTLTISTAVPFELGTNQFLAIQTSDVTEGEEAPFTIAVVEVTTGEEEEVTGDEKDPTIVEDDNTSDDNTSDDNTSDDNTIGDTTDVPGGTTDPDEDTNPDTGVTLVVVPAALAAAALATSGIVLKKRSK